MNISKKCVRRLSDNLIFIMILTVLQYYALLEFPGYSFLGPTMNIVARYILFITGIPLIAWFFVADNIEDGLPFTCAKQMYEPLRTYLRIFSTVFFLLFFHVGTYYFWYKTLHYPILFCIYTMAFMDLLYLFMYFAIRRRKYEVEV